QRPRSGRSLVPIPARPMDEARMSLTATAPSASLAVKNTALKKQVNGCGCFSGHLQNRIGRSSLMGKLWKPQNRPFHPFVVAFQCHKSVIVSCLEQSRNDQNLRCKPVQG